MSNKVLVAQATAAGGRGSVGETSSRLSTVKIQGDVSADSSTEPSRLEGDLWKKSPKVLSMAFQKRHFIVEHGELTYKSGKDEVITLKVSDILMVESVNADRLEFAFKVRTGREYFFRVETSADYSYWVRGLQRHVDHYK